MGPDRSSLYSLGAGNVGRFNETRGIIDVVTDRVMWLLPPAYALLIGAGSGRQMAA